MRDIKFRVWDKYDYPIYKSKHDPARMEYSFTWPWVEGAYNFNDGIKAMQEGFNYVFMQYTGLKDKNGVEIIENDIVRVFGGTNSDRVDVVTWNEYQAGFALKGAISGHLFGGEQIEVIGNIYENPELLKEL